MLSRLLRKYSSEHIQVQGPGIGAFTERTQIFNTDQGCQFTSSEFTGVLLDAGVAISMDGKGRCMDNIFVERLWRTVKYEEVYIRDYDSGNTAFQSLKRYFPFYNHKRHHQALGYQTPASVYQGSHN